MKRLTTRVRGKSTLGKGTSIFDIEEAIDRLTDIEDILGDEYDLDRLREREEADREGRCVVLPCKIGSPVYSHARRLDGTDYVKETEFWWSDIPQMSKTVFLTCEEAEAALRREQDG